MMELSMDMSVVAILGLATHRVVSIWAVERILAPLREWTLRTWLAPLTGCPFCVSVWVATGFLLLWLYAGRWGQAAVLVFAISDAAVVIEFAIRRLTR